RGVRRLGAERPRRRATERRPMTARSRFTAGLLLIALLALARRTPYPAADPPWRTTVGVVWHDEGAWVHNARNKALFGAWRQDEWNPMFIAPVFTALEYASFAAFGVGVRQARLVVELAGVASVVLLALGVAAVWALWETRRTPDAAERRVAIWTLGGVALALGAALVVFVLPHWAEYRFYNWQMSVTRKPSYTLKSILDRVTWFPILHDT